MLQDGSSRFDGPSRRPSYSFMSRTTSTGMTANNMSRTSSRAGSQGLPQAPPLLHQQFDGLPYGGLSSRRSSTQSVQSVGSNARSGRSGHARTRILEFAKMKNPTLSIRLTEYWTFDFTYAELLQYASVALSARRLTRMYWWPFSQPRPYDGETGNRSISTSAGTSVIVLLNTVVLVTALASLDMRRKGEQLGLRRTWLILCSALFVVSCFVALWPAGGVARLHSQSLSSRLDDWLVKRRESTREALYVRTGSQGDESAVRLPPWPRIQPEQRSLRQRSAVEIQVCTKSTSEQKASSSLDCQDDVYSAVRDAIEQMLGAPNGGQNTDVLSQTCDQLPAGSETLVRVRTGGPHSLFVLCNDASTEA